MKTNQYDLCVHIFLDEGEIDLALEALATLRKQARFRTYHTDLAVAHAAEATHPRAAVEIYLEVSKMLIQQRGRGNYADAAAYLARVRALFQATGESAHWTALIARIREENRRLPAFQDELKQAGM